MPFNDFPLLIRRAWWAVGWFGVGLCIYLSLMHNPPSLDIVEGDKLQHIAAYSVLMVWFAQLTSELRQRRVTAASLLALGIAIEFAQLASGYREFEVADMAADAVGIGVGWLLAPPRLPNFLAWAQQVAAGAVRS